MKSTLPAFLLLATAGAIAQRTPDPREAVRAAAANFCAEVRRERMEGLPSPQQMKRLSPLLTPGLRAAIEQARTIQQTQIRAHPEEKPDWIEGDLFSSLFEGVTTWEVGGVFTAPTVDALVRITQTFREAGGKPVVWTDTLVFQPSGEAWLLDDIRMGGDWAFKPGGSLRGILPGGIREDQDHESPDGHWQVAFIREGDGLKRITIAPVDQPGRAVLLPGAESGSSNAQPFWVIWSPDSAMLALRTGADSRFSRTVVYRHAPEGWEAVALPEFFATERETMRSNGFKEEETRMDADHWQDNRTLVVKYFTSFTNGSDSDGYYRYVRVGIDGKGGVRVLGSVDVPGGE